MSGSADDETRDLEPTFAEGFKLGQKKTVAEYATLDANDESLARWKASLGVVPGAAANEGPKVTVLSLFLTSPTLGGRKVELDVCNSEYLAGLKKNPINIKEGVEYTVGITFQVNYDVISGLRYIHVVKRAGVKVDKMEQMIGSYGPSNDGKPHLSLFATEESPYGMLARSGSYTVRSRVIDDDKHVYADFEWTFKIAKEWA